METILETIKEVGLFFLYLFEKVITIIFPIVKMYSFENLVKSIPGIAGIVIGILLFIDKKK